MRSRNQILEEVLEEYINSLDMNNIPEPREIEAQLINNINDAIALENQIRPKGEKLRKLEVLDHDMIAKLMLATNSIVCVNCGDESNDIDKDMLAIYKADGINKGTYRCEFEEFKIIASKYNPRLTKSQLKDVIERLHTIAPRVERCMDRDLIAVNNGIFNYKTKEMQDFTPDIVFLSKSHVNYNHAAQNVVIHNDEDGTDWDVESWMQSLSDDPEIVDFIWKVIGAVVRPIVNWNVAALFYSDMGNNGKGTLCELMRGIVGKSSCASLPLNSFSKDFALEPLVRATAIITDENDVGGYIDKAGTIKSVITHDIIHLNLKYQAPVSFRALSFMIQCVNELPRSLDRTSSWYRRYVVVPFTKCFTGVERKYIKADYLHRTEVLEYCLYKVLNMNYYELKEPKGCKEALEAYKTYNEPVRQFWLELRDQFSWSLLPYSFMYELYKNWYERNNPSGRPEGRNTFIKELQNVVYGDEDWEAMSTDERERSDGRMFGAELLIAEYNVVEWKNQDYSGGSLDKVCRPRLAESYAGLLRVNAKDSDTNE